jgi:hypothetical protein
MSQLRRLTIFADDADDIPSEDVLWVRAWLERWQSKVRVADYSSGGWEHLWDVEGPEEAIAEVPERLHCHSDWANPEISGDDESLIRQNT